MCGTVQCDSLMTDVFLLCKLVSHYISKHILLADVGNTTCNFTLGIFCYSRSFLDISFEV